MHRQLGFAVRLMALGGLVLTGEPAGAGPSRGSSTDSKPARGATLTARETAAPSGTVEVAVDLGRTTRLYRFDRATGKLTLLREVGSSEAASVTSRYQELKVVETQIAGRDHDQGGAVAPEGKLPPPKGGPPGGDDPGSLLSIDLDNLNRELAALKLDKTQVKLGAVQASAP